MVCAAEAGNNRYRSRRKLADYSQGVDIREEPEALALAGVLRVVDATAASSRRCSCCRGCLRLSAPRSRCRMASVSWY